MTDLNQCIDSCNANSHDQSSSYSGCRGFIVQFPVSPLNQDILKNNTGITRFTKERVTCRLIGLSYDGTKSDNEWPILVNDMKDLFGVIFKWPDMGPYFVAAIRKDLL